LNFSPFFLFNSTNDPHSDVESVLTGYKKEPESEAQLEKLLPHIISCFSPNKSVAESVEELKKYGQSGDATGNRLRSYETSPSNVRRLISNTNAKISFITKCPPFLLVI
jgi:hypothetical protein